jgi:acetyl-CoA carboxylase biotin carboxylase subunit
MKKLGIPVVPGSDGGIETESEALKQATATGFPVLIKAASGGGGKGMKVAYSEEEVLPAYRLAKTEANVNFGNDQVYMERYLQAPRHIEFQILADKFGHVVCLGERDCSIQRNHQKIFEVAPAPNLPIKMRDKMLLLISKTMRKLGYVGVGTVEMLVEDGSFYFMEMNTRLQVEHPITEMITGVDLLKEQILVAANLPLTFGQKDIRFNGHAIECRITAEDPSTFLPAVGTIKTYHPAGGLGVRVDSHIYSGYVIPRYYDSMIGKIIVHAKTRAECLAKLRGALQEFVIDGVSTIIPLHQKLVEQLDIVNGTYDIHYLSKHLDRLGMA